METATPIILAILVIIITFLCFCWIYIVAWYDKILDFIAKIKPFSAKRKYKKDLREAERDCKKTAKNLKKRIRNERERIKAEINDNIGYCYIDIIFNDNFEWLKKKGFKVTETKEKSEYKVEWCNKK